jgi:hypothetical protein
MQQSLRHAKGAICPGTTHHARATLSGAPGRAVSLALASPDVLEHHRGVHRASARVSLAALDGKPGVR